MMLFLADGKVLPFSLTIFNGGPEEFMRLYGDQNMDPKWDQMGLYPGTTFATKPDKHKCILKNFWKILYAQTILHQK